MQGLLALVTLSLSVCGYAAARSPSFEARDANGTVSICDQIQSAISNASDVYFPELIPLADNYNQDIAHWATSSTQQSECSVEPGSTEDVGTILQILGASQTPFAVKGGGHATNPGWSSTTGVHIALSRFSEVTYNADTQTVDIGAGLIWDDVYAALAPFNVSVVGGRVTGVGVAGFILGGGYSWKSNQYGLTIDTVQSYEIVLPDGTVTEASQTSNPDLFFALKGGWNNYGIVTKFTLQAFPQTDVWGGLITVTEDHLDAVTNATAKFAAEVTDPKASIITTYNFLLGQTGVSLLLFYDGPTPPAGIFDDFTAIPAFTTDVSTRSLLSLVTSSPANATAGVRGIFHSVSLTNVSQSIVTAIVNETEFWGKELSAHTGTFISYDVEPFLPSLFSHGAASAYPPSRDRALYPLNIYYAWLSSNEDDLFHSTASQSAEYLTQLAVAEGQDIADATLYGNYAIYSTPLERILGSNIDSLTSTKAKYDPGNVMSLAGGWKVGA